MRHNHTLAHKLAADALDRFTTPGERTRPDDWQRQLLAGQDANLIIGGAILEELMRLNNNGHRSLREKAKAAAIPVLGGGGLATLATIRVVEFLVR
tara:strand:+ start:261 stop:548 length:288 start_codon:yes stop_codon:yes gene_type:complete